MTSESRCVDCKRPSDGYRCAPCLEKLREHNEREQLRQWETLTKGNLRMTDWSLATFPADDPAGRKALEEVEPWLWAHVGVRLIHGPNGLRGRRIKDTGDESDYEPYSPLGWWEGDGGPNLFLWGGVGSGKTGLAWSLLRARVQLQYDYEPRSEYPRFVNVVELLSRAKAAMGAGEDGGAIVRDLYHASVLVLDDLGAERPTEWARNELAQLIQHRYTHNTYGHQPTIVTSNYAPSQLAARLGHDDPVIGQRIVSRLTERCLKVKLDRADLRPRKAA